MSDTGSMTLTEFLLARIAEDEEVARAAIEDDGGHDCGYEDAYDELIRPPSGVGIAQGGFGEAAARMIATYAVPRRILDECRAKRRIIERHTIDCYPSDEGDEYVCDECHADGWHVDEVLCEDLLDLASVYANRLGYRQEWRSDVRESEHVADLPSVVDLADGIRAEWKPMSTSDDGAMPLVEFTYGSDPVDSSWRAGDELVVLDAHTGDEVTRLTITEEQAAAGKASFPPFSNPTLARAYRILVKRQGSAGCP